MRWPGWLILIGGLVGLSWFFPPFRVVSLERAQQEKVAATFNAKDYADQFWNQRLLKSLDQAVKLEVLLPALRVDAAAARKQFSRSVGVSESYIYFVSGKGRVLAVNEDEIVLAITAGVTNAEVTLQVGLLFSNAVRDGTGLLNVSDFPNSQDFNAISAALNQIIEERVQPGIRAQAKVGAVVQFVGCAEVADEATDLLPLKVIPIQADVP